ncbi:MAG: hypothetical protein JWL62_324 [Hyphomicrobiales bacterium]|nr:hypothetical protein [Hyphomicrobiales bacterium]
MADDMSLRARVRTARWRNSVAGFAVLSAGFLAAGSAQAQVYGFFDTWHSRWGAEDAPPPLVRQSAPLRRADVDAMLGNRGYQVEGPIDRNGDVFIADTTDPRGHRMRVIVDAYDGSILERFPGRAVPRPSVGLREDGLRDEPYRSGERDRFIDQDRFENADRFDEQRAVRERVARPSTQDLDQRYIQRLPDPQRLPDAVDANGEPRVIRGIGPRPATPPKAATAEQPRKKVVARTKAEPATAPAAAAKPASKPLASEASKTPAAAAPAEPAPQTAAVAPRVIPLYKAPPDVSPEAAKVEAPKAEAPKVIAAPAEAATAPPPAPSGD